ncbi:MAG: hypothetical protein JOY93_10030 [Acidobacteriales bacterium]|nr:hypothetical protein [Terriglobales bacterium]
MLAKAGFTGVQFAKQGTPEELAICRAHGFGIAAGGRINAPSEADPFAEQIAGSGYECATLHVGWGLEDDDQAHRLIESILAASSRYRIPLYIETHRATICQDMWRTVHFVRRFPEMRFNGDFSHWYTGQEMVYGGFEKKFAFIRPVLERVRFLHGRIANPGCIQIPVERDATPQPPYVQHFQQLWTASFKGFLRSAQPEDYICFTPELLAGGIYYARTFGNKEESDRWEQSLILKEIAERCFTCAQSSSS